MLQYITWYYIVLYLKITIVVHEPHKKKNSIQINRNGSTGVNPNRFLSCTFLYIKVKIWTSTSIIYCDWLQYSLDDRLHEGYHYINQFDGWYSLLLFRWKITFHLKLLQITWHCVVPTPPCESLSSLCLCWIERWNCAQLASASWPVGSDFL